MCGIVGYVSTEIPLSRGTFAPMVDSLSHRGPDGRGERYFDGDKVALGHRRLAIVDTSEQGAQPISNKDERYWLTFNGEIYNHLSLRGILESRGYIYKSKCDAETVVHAYAEWGEECVTKFRGIFSFAIWDNTNKTLFAARDHLGVKPFYFLDLGRGLAFGSEAKALLNLNNRSAEIDKRSFLDYLCYGIVPEARSAFKGIRKLPPAHYLTWKYGRMTQSRYWQVDTTREAIDSREAEELVASKLEEVVELQLMGDVPIGAYLSGGIDSSVVTALASRKAKQPVPTFTIGFQDPRSDERRYARLVAASCNTDHHEQVLTREYALSLVDKMVETYDEPYGLGAAFPMLFISEMTKSYGIKAVLAGDGADELFAGYRHYDDFDELYRKRGKRTANRTDNYIRAILETLKRGRFDPSYEYFPREGSIPAHWIRKLICRNDSSLSGWDPKWRYRKYFDANCTAVRAAQLIDLQTYLPDEILVKLDRATMAYGVEARVPFLDPELVELAFRMGSEIHYQAGERKSLLKKVAKRWLPAEVVTNRKKGFSIPLRTWLLDRQLMDDMVTAITTGSLVDHGLLKSDATLEKTLRSMKKEHVWQIFLGERWARRWISE